MSETDRILSEDARKDHPYVVALRRAFHAHPELSTKEEKTAERIESELASLGLVTTRIAGTGVIADIKGLRAGDKKIVLRADIDALPVTEAHESSYKSTCPGVMHACGHDAHAASLIGTARLLSRHRDLFGGTVRLVFQPGEEVGYGGRAIVNEGVIDGFDRSFGLHLASSVRAGSLAAVAGAVNAAVDWFRITIHGKGVHVATPERGVDALYIASAIVVEAQALVTRLKDPMEPLLLGIGKLEAGVAYNVVAESAIMEGTIRSFNEDLRAATKKRLEDLSEKIAESYGGSATIEWHDNTSALINDSQATSEVQAVARRLFGAAHVITNARPSLGGDDFAEFNKRVPGMYAFIGSQDPLRPETAVAHHDARFDIDEESLYVATALEACYAVDYLNGTVNE